MQRQQWCACLIETRLESATPPETETGPAKSCMLQTHRRSLLDSSNTLDWPARLYLASSVTTLFRLYPPHLSLSTRPWLHSTSLRSRPFFPCQPPPFTVNFLWTTNLFALDSIKHSQLHHSPFCSVFPRFSSPPSRVNQNPPCLQR